MKNKKLIKFVESLIFLPILTVTPHLGNLPGSSVGSISVPQVIVLSETNQTPVATIDPILKLQADAIDAYFTKHDMPLAGTGIKMTQAASDNDLDWRLLPAIAVRESTGGKNDCTKVKNNPFGWGSCKIGFNSLDEAIEVVAKNLGGNNPNTARAYDNKTTLQILRIYNPPSVIPKYASQVMSIMKEIGNADLGVTYSAT